MKILYSILISLLVLNCFYSCGHKGVIKDQRQSILNERAVMDSLSKVESNVSIEREVNPTLAVSHTKQGQLPGIYCNLSKIYAASSDFKTSIALLDSAKRLAALNKNWAFLSS